MLILCYVLLAVYLVAINFYGGVLLHYQKKSRQDGCEGKSAVGDGRLFFTGVLGGALGIYASMFILKYRLKSLFLMVVMPLLIVINTFILIEVLNSNFGIIVA